MNHQRMRIKKATSFAVRYCYAETLEIYWREFRTAKIMEQWIKRNDTLSVLIIQRYALIDGEWDAIIISGNRIITLTELRKIVKDLEDNSIPTVN